MLRFAGKARENGSQLGFVPTMGALHAGHGELVKRAKRECDVVAVSVFVNPTQFNQQADLETYPRTFDEDRQILESLCVDVMFFPSVDEIYPNGTDKTYQLDGLDTLMEGPNRPGHFNGVVQVVTRLFDLVQPIKAYFGEKDFQQLAIIRHMSKKLGYSTQIIGCETVREADGLAMSSRNRRLSQNGRTIAPVISKALNLLRSEVPGQGIEKAKSDVIEYLNSVPEIDLEYLELVDHTTLQLATDKTVGIQACCAAWIDGVRLIDNLRVK